MVYDLIEIVMILKLEKKKIKTEENLEKLFTPKFYTCGKYYENQIRNCKMIKR